MDMFPHTVTLYNISEDSEYHITSNITLLQGVLLDASKGVNVRTSGIEEADAVNLYIPFSVSALDGMSGKKKRYVGPKEYMESENKDELWTLEPGNKCFFAKGRILKPGNDFQTINRENDDVYRVTKVDEKDFGGEMSHWEVGGA